MKKMWQAIKKLYNSLFQSGIKRGRWSDLTKEERLRAKAMMYGAGARGTIQPNEEGNIVIEYLEHKKDDNEPAASRGDAGV
ncbi:MAG: hypothetical protein PHO37_12505 [Kiritimatiellae bacterium]|nr:hypothetical protein [Kiritimatiellia bacterium]